MPWDTNDYPSSLKNLDTAVRKKAIDIANAMVNEGYDEGRAIPIATKQAKEWYQHASKSDINHVLNQQDQALRQRDDNPVEGRPELMEKGEHVVTHEDGWAVQTQGAKQPANVYRTKKQAVNRAKEIAKNKGTSVIIHQQDGQVKKQYNYSN